MNKREIAEKIDHTLLNAAAPESRKMILREKGIGTGKKGIRGKIL